jgi:putative restriction endonuclease
VALQFGHVPGYPPGSLFISRAVLKAAGLHFRNIDGISWQVGETGADAIALNAGYPEDDDRGDEITYSGEGGRTGQRRTAPQYWTKGNLALRESWMTGRPVRVIRGPRLPQRSPFRPPTGYRYDGLYEIVDVARRNGVDGFPTCLFELVRLPGDSPPWAASPAVVVGAGGKPKQVETVVLRTVRDTKVARSVKKMHADQCQVCGIALELPEATYSEGAHIQPLGRMHAGPDRSDNVLCLCPTHHVLLDYGALFLTDKLDMIDRRTGKPLGALRTTPKHVIDIEYVRYHRIAIAGQDT